ncbi:MAG TPA: helix-turn-helix domain-containing protein [Polyangia bacterium]|nr:helix-turn-helix domain-containing protein [Polyangia bacterium]
MSAVANKPPLPPDPLTLISSKRTAAMLGIQLQTLRRWRYEGKGPRHIRMGFNKGSRVAYRLVDIVEWIEKHTFSSTAHETVSGEQYA